MFTGSTTGEFSRERTVKERKEGTCYSRRLYHQLTTYSTNCVRAFLSLVFSFVTLWNTWMDTLS